MIYFNILECPCKIVYKKNETAEKFELNHKASNFTHNHPADPSLVSKCLDAKAKDYMIEEIKKKKMTPAKIQEKLNDKFGIKYIYQAVANASQNIDLQLFGSQTEDAETLKNLILKLKEKVPQFLGEILKEETTNKLKGLIFATPLMKELANKYMDLLIMDTTFGTNRFRMKHWTMCGKDNNNRTIIFAEGLIAQETTEQFSWLLSQAKGYFNKEPNFILMDSDPALIAAVESIYPNSNLKMCGWHTENNIKKHLYGLKKGNIF